MKTEARRMTIGTKFLLIGVASLVPLGFTLALWLVEIDSRVVQVDNERVGLTLHGTLKRVLAESRQPTLGVVVWQCRRQQQVVPHFSGLLVGAANDLRIELTVQIREH